MPIPEVLYSSPLRRAIDTVELTWSDIQLREGTERHVSSCLGVPIARDVYGGKGADLGSRSKRT